MRINLWSGPRNVSTALMYSFRQRSDTRVIDEPFYGHYLAYCDAEHPGGREVVASMDTNIHRIIEEVVLGPCDRPVLFMKQMAHHLIDTVPLDFVDRCVNLLLIRNPVEVLTTIVRQLPNPTLRDIGIARQTELKHQLEARGLDVPVLDAELLLRDPPGVLQRLCDRIGLPWDPAMLTWPAGPKPEDGVWAEHWYENAHRSTGFAPFRPKDTPVPDALEALATTALEHYEPLRSVALH